MRTLLLAILLGSAGFYAYLLLSDPDVPDVTFPDATEALAQGEYLIAAGGCVSCHEGQGADGMSGGLALNSEFGTFYVPNITPDIQTGIGSWTASDFLAAMKHGRTPSGSWYYPAFPYRAYAGVSDEDVLAIGAYLMAQPAVSSEVSMHEIPGWLFRWMMPGWNLLADWLEPGPAQFEDSQIARGAYLVNHLGHCAECHTPRNRIGILDANRSYEGGPFEDGNIEPINAEGLADWTQEDFELFLFLGIKPDGEFVGGKMEAVIAHNTSQLTEEDQAAMAAYFMQVVGGR